jgi:CubicO group peptidase (beta-lactamase class C family)
MAATYATELKVRLSGALFFSHWLTEKGRRMSARHFLGLSLSVLLALQPVEAAAMPELDRRLEALAQSGGFAGAVVIRRRGRTLHEGGYGLADPQAGLAFSPRTVVETGSVTKPVVAAAVLRLAAEGRIELDSRVRSFVPEYPHEATTIRQLLTHGGGLPDYSAFDADLNSGRVVATPDLLALIATHRPQPAVPPGSRFSYCNICFDTLALLVERVTGQSFFAHVRDRFLDPAGARGVFLRPARLSDWRGFRVRGYRRTPAGVEPNDVFDNEGFYGGGNLYFSADDLAAWMAAWANGDRPVARIRSEATAPVRFPDGLSGLTLGNWYCAPSRTRCYYPGHHQGFHAFGYWDSERRLAIAFVSNGTLSPQLQVAIPRLLIAAAEGRRLPPSPAGAPASRDIVPGAYSLAGISTVEISSSDTGVEVKVPTLTSYRLFAAGDGWHYVPGLDAYLAAGPAEGELRWSAVFLQTSGWRRD